MIKNVIFDIGMVLADFRWKDYIVEIGIPADKRERVAAATTCGAYWNEMDRGIMSFEEIVEGCVSLDPEIEPEIRLFFKDMRRLVLEFPFAAEWVKSVKERGYGVYILSNYGEHNFACLRPYATFFQYVDGEVISYREKVIKPDSKIYQILLERYKLNPEECIFLDDRADNIETARSLGIQGIVVKTHEQAAADLESELKGQVP